MNKQELIKEFEEIGIHGLNMFGTVVKGIPTETAIDLIKQLDEPQPVKVPQVVADMIEGARGQSVELEDAFEYAREVATIEFREWFRKLENRNNFARAWLDGYEVEKEKRYIVSLNNRQPLTKTQSGKVLYFNQNIITGNYKFTRKELEEAGFGWVFDCPGIEIEEVEYDTNA